MVLAGFFHLSGASSFFLIHRVISGRSAASNLVWFAWRRWQWCTAVALVMTGMSVLQSYRHTPVIFKIPHLSPGCSLRGHIPVPGFAQRTVDIHNIPRHRGVRAHVCWRAMALGECSCCGRLLWCEGPALPLGSSWKACNALWGSNGDVGEEVKTTSV